MKYKIDTDFIASGRYRSRKLIARGAAGEVFLADVIKPPGSPFPEQVAVKTFPNQAGFSTNAQRREIESMRLLKHPNIVELYDWGMSNGCHFMVFPYYSRGALADYLHEHEQLTPEEGVAVLRDMALALSAIHERGLLHLDMKPGNILIADDGSYVLSDLGIASFQFMGSHRGIKGTPLFMSPEQARGDLDKLDARTDLFSLGATLYYALCGSSVKPLDSEDVMACRRREGIPMEDWALEAPYGFLAKVIRKLTAYEPHLRFGSASEVISLLEQNPQNTIHGEPDRGEPVDRHWRKQLSANLGDPVLRTLLSSSGTYFKLRFFPAGRILCTEEESSFDVFILLHGKLKISRKGNVLGYEDRIGSIMGEVAALIGKPRTATLTAEEDSVCVLLNGAELEQAARKMPALAVRIMKALALHLFERDQGTE